MRNLLVVDDDEITREILTVYGATTGYSVTVAVSGDEALTTLGRETRGLPDVILADVHMAGTAGASLAACLRATCGDTSKLIAMSANSRRPTGFDGFMQKPFTLEEFQTAVAGVSSEVHKNQLPSRDVASLPVLDETVYRTLKRSLPDADLAALYAMCLEDIQRRIERMRYARRAGLADLFGREAHAILGSCGFVGASKLSRLAAELEQQGPDVPAKCGSTDPLDVLTEERELLLHTVANYRRFAAPTEGRQKAERHRL